eukprot:CAMPEP_0183706654 /NCGR_PEP_ID=MMETSP0737-20130205/3423_1 /TAXON_ID=385413 /ORGANISM="Thalassiosira miniscula, Strain CCMP1093" /LENGTH=335 /DNA_ID=CAMNT_0025934117 /DNA_START=183 /DNA_END=1190 /DNA_ORIENTATION=+
MAVPKGTPYFAGAMGTVNTCTAQGFIGMVVLMAVPTYYGSLALQAFLGLKNNYNEDKYRWIEIPVHIIAYLIGSVYAIINAATNNFNPNGSGCWHAKAPWGCESDPDVPCERGEDTGNLGVIMGLTLAFLYLIFPPLMAVSMYCWLKKKQKELSGRNSFGMTLIRENARKETMRSAYLQISLYLFSFWFTYIFGLISQVHKILTDELSFNLTVIANCVNALQGFVFMIVYFTLQRMGEAKVEKIQISGKLLSRGFGRQPTVAEIRKNAEKKNERDMAETEDNMEQRESFVFNIFDGEPDPDSPWAKFIDPDGFGDDEHSVSGGEQPMPNENVQET